MKWCPVVHRSEKIRFKRLKQKISFCSKATTSKNLLVQDRVSVKAEHLSNPIEEGAYDKKVPPKRNGNYDGARRSKNELDIGKTKRNKTWGNQDNKAKES